MRDPLKLLRELEEDPASFEFYAALRQLECAFPDKPRIGQSQRPQDDAVRFSQPPSLGFESAMIGGLKQPAEGLAPRLDINFFGLLGANGPMPIHITEYTRDRLRNSADPSLARFLDIFNHRLIALLYRVWASAQPVVSLDRPGNDRFSDYAASLIGFGTEALRGRDRLPDAARYHYAGHLAAHVRNAEGLEAILSDFFRVPVKVQEFQGRWMSLPSDSLCRLRSGPDAEGLGMGTVLGSRVWSYQDNFRLVIGPLDFADLERLLPGGDSLGRLVDWVRSYAGLTLAWDINLILKREQVPPLRLGRQARLGWTSWLSSRPPPQDDRQLVLNPLTHDRPHLGENAQWPKSIEPHCSAS